VKAGHSLLSIAAAMIAAMLGADAPGAEEASAILSPQALREIAQVEAEIDRIEAQTIERLAVPPDNQVQQIELLGKLMLYDKQLSVNRNEACAFCHMPETGFTIMRARNGDIVCSFVIEDGTIPSRRRR
jgi:cytochrome c peroxidase